MRPGPLDAGMHKVYQRRKKGEEPVSYQLPELEEILAPTYGVITYQEQVMRIAQRLAGISLAEADVLRKAVGKKDAELIRKELGKFVDKAIAKGFDKQGLERGGMKLIERKETKVCGLDGLLVYASQEANGQPYRKWVALCGNEKRTVLLNAVFPAEHEAEL